MHRGAQFPRRHAPECIGCKAQVPEPEAHHLSPGKRRARWSPIALG
jgi:hypothetical protein